MIRLIDLSVVTAVVPEYRITNAWAKTVMEITLADSGYSDGVYFGPGGGGYVGRVMN